ncbi:MAG: hypothetical protein HY656_05105, partial [Acidobacteria bacterium]|nr:hypothetical protein [Acidobacteriota bacterium]
MATDGEQTVKHASPAWPWTYSESLIVFLALFTVLTFTLSQSVYEMLLGNPDFLLFRRVSNWQLLGIVLVFNWLPALGLFALCASLRRWHPWLGLGFLAAVYFLLFVLFFGQVHNHQALAGWRAVPNSYWVWVVPAGLLALASLRFPSAFQNCVLTLSPVLL